LEDKQISKKEFLVYFKEYNEHHAHARGAILYAYWSEGAVTEELKRKLKTQLDATEIDAAVSLLSTSRGFDGPLTELYKVPEDQLLKKQKLLDKLNLNARGKELVKILSAYTFFYEMGERISGRLFDELLKKLHGFVQDEAKFEELSWYTCDDLLKYFDGLELSMEELELRKKMYILLLENGEFNLMLGNQAQDYYNKYLQEEVAKNANTLSGTVASMGKAKGKVKIVIKEKDQNKMNKGDILVSTMTTPNMTSAIKKAAAIVTDEGGLTAHAAIVSREFDIPCVVGTRFATQILKDGDMLEVDAENGIIKKILQ